MNNKTRDEICLRLFRLRYDQITDTDFADDILQVIKEQIDLATMPSIDLNDTQYDLQRIEDPIDMFNLFIKKWCPHYAHLIDSDDNDGEFIRKRIKSLREGK